jgi:hypothetical protein
LCRADDPAERRSTRRRGGKRKPRRASLQPN